MTSIQRQFTVPFDYSVSFTRGLFDVENPLFRDAFEAGASGTARFGVVIDSGVAECHPGLEEKIRRYVASTDGKLTLSGKPLIVEGGEACKNSMGALESVLELMETQRIDRHSYVVAIGGGALLDMVGFAAGICHRGVRMVRVPTTVLSQNDSGVGVKNSFNLFGKKNFLGTFATPDAVLNDSTFLTTLESRDWAGGTAEAVKVALLKDRDFFEWMEENGPAIYAGHLGLMEHLVQECARYHMDHIATSGDPFERGSSRPLDFGHWAAHKLEQITDFELRHGEAVAIGIALDVAYSYRKGMLSREACERVWRCLMGLGLDITHPALFTGSNGSTRINPAVLKGLVEFQEHLGGQLTIMLLSDLGKGVEVHEMDHALIETAALDVRRWVGEQERKDAERFVRVPMRRKTGRNALVLATAN